MLSRSRRPCLRFVEPRVFDVCVCTDVGPFQAGRASVTVVNPLSSRADRAAVMRHPNGPDWLALERVGPEQTQADAAPDHQLLATPQMEAWSPQTANIRLERAPSDFNPSVAQSQLSDPGVYRESTVPYTALASPR
jgi:hypothetical protein